MPTDAETSETTTLAPDDAFSVLGNKTRMKILQTLGEADESLSFSALRDRVGVSDSGQFNYHLDQLTGHFVRQTDEGYVLRQAGSRVIEAVLSGAVTEARELETTRLDAPCPYCRSDIEVSYREERMLIRCTECAGIAAGIESTSAAFPTLPEGTLTLYYLPSAGFQGRTLRETLDAVLAWTFSEQMAMGNGVCPRCSGNISHSLEVCEDHDSENAICDRCNLRYPLIVEAQCENCNHMKRSTIRLYLMSDPTVRSFFETRGVDPIAPDWEDMSDLYNRQEEILGADPFEARITYTADGDHLTVAVDDHLNVTNITKSMDSEPA